MYDSVFLGTLIRTIRHGRPGPVPGPIVQVEDPMDPLGIHIGAISNPPMYINTVGNLTSLRCQVESPVQKLTYTLAS